MNTKLTILSAIAFGALAPPTLAGPTEYASGLLHEGMGGVSSLTVDAARRKLMACCLGSTGKDGVEVRFESAWGGGAGFDVTPLFEPNTIGNELRVSHKGWDGTIKGHTRVTSNGDGSVTLQADFTGLGATGLDYEALDGNGVVVESGPFPGGGIQAYLDPCCPPGAEFVWWYATAYVNGQWITYIDWRCITIGTVSGLPDITALRLIPQIPPGGTPPLDGLESFVVTEDDFPMLSIFEAQVHTFGVAAWGLGDGRLDEDCDDLAPCAREQRRLLVSNIGSSGQDGVSLNFESDNLGFPGGLGADDEVAVSVVGSPVLGTETMKYQKTGHVTLLKREITPNPATGELDVSLDFGGVGAGDYEMCMFDSSGTQVACRVLPNNIPWTVSPCPVGQVWVSRWPPKFSGCEMVVDPVGLIGGPFPGVTDIEFTPIGVTITDRLAAIEITSTDAGGTLVIDDVVISPPCPGDLDGSGDVGLSDLAGLLASFGTSAGQPLYNPLADLDGDNTIGLSDLAGLLALFGSSCG